MVGCSQQNRLAWDRLAYDKEFTSVVVDDFSFTIDTTSSIVSSSGKEQDRHILEQLTHELISIHL